MRICFSVWVGGTLRAKRAPSCGRNRLSYLGVHKATHDVSPTNVQTPPKRRTHATPFFPYSAVSCVGSPSDGSTMVKITLDAMATYNLIKINFTTTTH